jgi:hypothetical protein
MRNKQKEKKVTSLADDLLRKVEQADQLKDLAKRNPEEASRVNTIIDTFMNPGSDIYQKQKVYEKIDIITALIGDNISIVKRSGTSHFDWTEYQLDSKFVFNIKAAISATDIIQDDDLRYLNEVYKKHQRLNKIFTEK